MDDLPLLGLLPVEILAIVNHVSQSLRIVFCEVLEHVVVNDPFPFSFLLLVEVGFRLFIIQFIGRKALVSLWCIPPLPLLLSL